MPTWLLTRTFLLGVGLPLILLFIGVAHYVGYRKDCVQSELACRCESGDHREECAYVCTQRRDCNCEEEKREIKASILSIDAFVKAREVEITRGEKPNWTSGGRIGRVSDQGSPIVDKSIIEGRCRSIAEAIHLHELDHIQWTNSVGPCSSYTKYLYTRFILGYTAKSQNESERRAYAVESKFLELRLAELEAHCAGWLCRCNQQIYTSASDCANGCPPARLGICLAPTCLELDAKTGKWIPGRGRAF